MVANIYLLFLPLISSFFRNHLINSTKNCFPNQMYFFLKILMVIWMWWIRSVLSHDVHDICGSFCFWWDLETLRKFEESCGESEGNNFHLTFYISHEVMMSQLDCVDCWECTLKRIILRPKTILFSWFYSGCQKSWSELSTLFDTMFKNVVCILQ